MEVSSIGEIIRSLPWGLVGWYGFDRKDRILCIGREEDPLAGFFHVGGYDFECLSIEELKSDVVKERFGRYGCIVCIAYQEQTDDLVYSLKALKTMLKRDGHLLLGMNNRLGSRYLCGDTDPYTGREFDGVEGYIDRASSNAKDRLPGRCYSRSEIKKLLEEAGLSRNKFYSVLPGLDDATMLLSEGYVPNEDLSNRVFPSYNSPQSVFMKEESLYPTLIREGLFHGMANAYLIECSPEGELSDALQITSSLPRGRENATYTVIRGNGTVEKRAAWPEGREKLAGIVAHDEDLRLHGIRVVDSQIKNSTYVMPFIEDETAQNYLKRLLYEDRERFLAEMDRFRETVLRSSEIRTADDCTEVFVKGYFDLVPLNSFVIDGEFVFFDQEFCIEGLPVKVMAWRQIASFYFGDPAAEKELPMQALLDRYGLTEELQRWQGIEWGYLDGFLNNKELRAYREGRRTNADMIRKRREALDCGEGSGRKPYHIGYVAGAFDMFHIGHLNLLRRAKDRCDYLIAGVMSDERMYDLKKKYPIIPCNERMQVVAGCRYVDQVEELPADRAGIMDAYNMFHFDCMFSGDDHAEDAGWLAERERLRKHGSDIVFVSYTKETSSSEIRQKMKDDAEKVLPGDSRLLTDKNHRWIYTYDYAPDSVWEEWRSAVYASDGDKESGDSPVPSWIAQEADAVVGRFHCAGDTGREGIPAYVLLSDSHFAYNGTWDDTVASMKAISERFRLDSIIHLGDLTDGLLPIAKTKEIEDRVMSDMRSLGVPVHVMPGNHDYNYFRNNPDIRYPENSRYFIDDEKHKLRLIFIDSFDPKEEVRYGFSGECASWLDGALSSMSEGYRSIMFSHVPPLVRLQTWTKDIRNRAKLIEVLDRHADRIMALISGHSHCDLLFNDLHNGKFPIVLINCAKCEYFLEHKPKDAVVPFRRLGDRTQESFDIMQVDTANNEIYFTRFGAGSDRIVRDHKAEWA